MALFHFRVWPDLGGDLRGDLGGGLCTFKVFCCAHLRMCIYFLYITLIGFLGVDMNANLPDPPGFNISLTPNINLFLTSHIPIFV